MAYPSTRRCAVHMTRGYRSFNAGPYVRVECDTGHSHYLSQDEFQAAEKLAGRLSVAIAATRVANPPSEALAALLEAANTIPIPAGPMAGERRV